MRRPLCLVCIVYLGIVFLSLLFGNNRTVAFPYEDRETVFVTGKLYKKECKQGKWILYLTDIRSIERAYGEGSYDEKGYGEGGYDEKGYDEKGYGEGGYDEKGYGEGSYDEKGYGEGGYDEKAYGEEGYDEKGYGEEGYDEKAYGDDSYDEKGYGEEGYDEKGYGDDSYDEKGYGEEGYSEKAYGKEADGSKCRGVICYLSEKEQVQYEPKLGSYLRVEGTYRAFEEATNLGQFDPKSYYQFLNLDFSITNSKILNKTKEYDWLKELLYKLKVKWTQGYEKICTGEEAAFLSSIVLGDKSDMDEEIKGMFSRNGFAHILAVSGLHISFIGMAFYKLLRRTPLPGLLQIVLSCMMIYLYGEMIQAGASTNRAIIMFFMNLSAKVLGRTYDMATALAMAAILLVMMQPVSVTNSGFLLSFGAVLAILIFFPIVKEYFSLPDKYANRRILGKIWEMFLLSFSINFFTLPILLLFYYEVPLYSAVLNVIVIPLFSVVLFFAVTGGIVTMIHGGLGSVLLFPCKIIFAFYQLLCEWADKLPGARWIAGKPETAGVVVFYLLVLGLLVVLGHKVGNRKGERGRSIGEEGSRGGIGEEERGRSIEEEGSRRGIGEEERGRSIEEEGSRRSIGEEGRGRSIEEEGSRRGIGEEGRGRSIEEEGSRRGIGEEERGRSVGEEGSRRSIEEEGSRGGIGEEERGRSIGKKGRGQAEKSNRKRIIKGVFVCIMFIATVILTSHPQRETTVTFLDIGQGDCCVIHTKDGQVILIDGGSSDVSESGERRLIPFLKASGISRVDYAFISHPDNDHVSAVSECLSMQEKEGVYIQNIVLSQYGRSDESYLDIKNTAYKAGCKVAYFKPGDRLHLGQEKNELTIECLFPDGGEGFRDVNEQSLILSVRTRSVSLLFTGDMGQESEEKLLKSIEVGEIQADILKVAHHGSKYSTSMEFLGQVCPKVAIISCGEDNMYGHPHKETLERFEAVGSTVLITPEYGAITVEVGKEVEIYGFKE